MQNDGSTIEVRIALLRSRKTQVQIARRLGISKQYVHKVAKGQRRTAYVRKAIAKAAGKRIEDLWPSSPSKKAA
jgi:transcriptional regulator with XRE-family HTH domain